MAAVRDGSSRGSLTRHRVYKRQIEAGEGGRHGLVGERGDQDRMGGDHDLRCAVEEEGGTGEGDEEGEADHDRGDGDGEQEQGVEDAPGAGAEFLGRQGGPGSGGEGGGAGREGGQDTGDQGVQGVAPHDVLIVRQGCAGGQGAAPVGGEGRGHDDEEGEGKDGDEEEEEHTVDGPAGGLAMHQHDAGHLLNRRPYGGPCACHAVRPPRGRPRSGRGRRGPRTGRY